VSEVHPYERRRETTLRKVWPLVIGTGAVAATVVLPVSSARAEVSFTGRAEAVGIRMTVSNSAFPLGFEPEGVAPVSSADLSSLGDAQAMAAAPYPGSFAATAPGAVGGVYGVPLPNYPAVVSVSAGDAPAEQSLPGLELHADARPSRTLGMASVGGSGQGVTTRATVDSTEAADTGIVAEAASQLQGLALLDFLHVSRVESVARFVLDPSGERQVLTDLRIDGIAAPGLTFTLPAQSPSTVPLPNPLPGTPQPPALNFPPTALPGGGSTLAAPELGFRNGKFVVTSTVAGVEQRTPVPFDVVAGAFQRIGVVVTYQQAERAPTQVTAPTLTFSTTLPTPGPNAAGVDGPTPVSVELGRATASLQGTTSGTATGGPESIATGDISGADGAAGLLPNTPADPSAGGAVPLDAASIAGTPMRTPVPESAASNRAAMVGAAGRPSPYTDLYFVFVALAVAVFALGPALTLRGARSRWGS
jgi:hypothetical protein